jgi:hypothetical protein
MTIYLSKVQGYVLFWAIERKNIKTVNQLNALSSYFFKISSIAFSYFTKIKLNQFSFIPIESTFFYNDFHNQLMQILSSKYSEAPLNQHLNQLNCSLYPPTNDKA